MKKLAIACAMALATLAGTAQASAANALTFQFHGWDCYADCQTSHEVFGTLHMSSNFVPGNVALVEDFIDFDLHSDDNRIQLHVDGSDASSIFAFGWYLPFAPNWKMDADFHMVSPAYLFETKSNSQWRVLTFANGQVDPNHSMYGIFSNWEWVASPVPEPGNAAMLIGGLALLGGVARRRAAQR